MIIQLGKKYRIRSDSFSWMTEELVTRACSKDSVDEDGKEWKKGDIYEIWQLTVAPHHATLSSAVNSLINLRIRKSDANTVLEAVKEIKRICSEVREALEPAFEVKER